ncbi:hypothetical protein [Neobacillus sp. D3-1R]|uniref:hypothetical protein n=1 Tax=Neobacillus sp. D3-1R TaxID=3445778 RepID=UPI003FA0BC20
MGKDKFLQEIFAKNKELNDLFDSYWNHYSDFDTWPFWVAVLLLFVPLIILYKKIDRKKIFEIFFFGYTVHIMWTYIDIALENHNYFFHTFYLTPLLPKTIDVTGSLLPVGFLLIYQYCTNHHKNFYLYTVLLSAIFAFIFASIEKMSGLLILNKGFNQLHLFAIDVLIAYTAYWFTLLIRKFSKTNKLPIKNN